MNTKNLFKRSLSIIFALCLLFNVLVLSNDVTMAARLRGRDVTTVKPGCKLIYVGGEYIDPDYKYVLKRINDIRYEACISGNVPDPRDPSRYLTKSDYRPVKWSRDLERMAQLRAAEASVYWNHSRPNGDIKSRSISYNGVTGFWENLCGCSEVGFSIEMFYDEKEMWKKLKVINNDTGHYYCLIDPRATYIAVGSFRSPVYGASCAYESTRQTGLVEGCTGEYGYYVQEIEISNANYNKYFVKESNDKKYKLSEIDGIDYSAVFDHDYYIRKYPDIKAAFGDDHVKTLKHFINFGIKEGRMGNEYFDVHSYKKAYPDLRKAFGDDLRKYYQHYIKYGKKEGRICKGVSEINGYVTKYNGVDYKDVYDANYYVKRYPDLMKAFGYDENRLLKHFVTYGMKEGRQAKANFNVANYKARYKDLRKAFGNDTKSYYLHYIRYGKNEGRSGR